MSAEPTPSNEHNPIGIRSTDVGPFIQCSCGSNPSPHHWLAAHWPGDKDEGIRLANDVLAREIAPGPYTEQETTNG